MFRYLGTYLAKDGSWKLECDERLKHAHQAMGMLKNIWNNNNFSAHTKTKMYKAVIRSISIYGHKSWYIIVNIDNKILIFENKALQYILRIQWWDDVKYEN